MKFDTDIHGPQRSFPDLSSAISLTIFGFENYWIDCRNFKLVNTSVSGQVPAKLMASLPIPYTCPVDCKHLQIKTESQHCNFIYIASFQI